MITTLAKSTGFPVTLSVITPLRVPVCENASEVNNPKIAVKYIFLSIGVMLYFLFFKRL